MIAEAKTKTEVEAGVLARLFRHTFLPKVWIPDKTTRLLREMCAHRAALAADQTRIKNRIQSLLAGETNSDPGEIGFRNLTLAAYLSPAALGYRKLADRQAKLELPWPRSRLATLEEEV